MLDQSGKGVGLFGMEERARTVQGQIEIVSNPGKGTKVILEVPFNNVADALK
ncbi:ATP-binding protein [Bacillus sp. M6-12]|uniref:ATP-binding protein n=1 Tax=Bacillus sp. M6-12 TaxID=2054166 RepID=UPI0015E10D49|nr:ATP-binding protein [Bacillus sp. M6-12]